MRVLAIRGRNLASLAGDFAIDFEAEPLVGAGIFAITGPTGAGKSTLLDAMCLALFGSVPRLGAASGTRAETPQGDALAGNDARAILRHGEGEGFAEIDFVGRDGGRYRARWSVQRAHKKSHGALQATRQGLLRLDQDENLTDTKTETLKRIQALIGLSADQFRRAVLLAQGDFEAFIRADDNERAALLEKLTGSQIYTKLGIAAYERATVLKRQLQAIRDRIDAQHGLDDEARAEAELRRDAALEAVRTATLTLGALEAAGRWERDRATLTALIAESEAAVAQAALAHDAAAPRREALRQRRTAFAFAAEWQALGDAEAQAKAARADAGLLASAQTRTVATVATAETQATAAQAALIAETERAATLTPAIDEARTADRRIAETAAALAGLADTRTQRADALAACRAAEATAADRLADAQATREGHATWLAEQAALGPLAAREGELLATLGEHETATGRLADLAVARAEAEATHEAARAAMAEAGQTTTRTTTEHDAAQAALAEAEGAAPSPTSLAAHTARRDRLAALQPLRLDWRNKAERAEEVQTARTQLDADAGASNAERIRLVAEQAEVAAALPALAARLDEARRAGSLAELASDEAATRLRATLVEGDPCPVCGATAHARSAIDALTGAHLDQQRARIASLDTELAAQRRHDATLATRIETLVGRTATLASAIALQDTALARAIDARDAAYAALAVQAEGSDLDPVAAGFDTALAQAIANADAERKASDAAQAALAAARTAEATTRAARDRANAAYAAAVETQRTADDALRQLGTSLAHLQESADRAGKALDTEMGRAIEWRTLRDPAKWLVAQAAAWRTRSAEHAEAVAGLPALDKAAASARTASATAQALGDEIEAQAGTLDTALAAYRETRAALLGGESVAVVETRRDAALAALRQTQESAQTGLTAALQARSAATARSEAAHAAADRAEAAHRDRDAAFHARIATQSLTADLVSAAAAAGETAIEQEAAAIAAIDQAARDCTTALSQRRDDLARHEASDPPTITGDALATATAQARDEVATVQAALDEAQFHIRRDDEVRAATATLRIELEREREAAGIWLELDTLIGDSSGAKFRRFAQGLTLDRLLAHANARLTELKPRYALQRGAGADMLIQVVDHDMAGEVRGVHNLSGGERFLVSLALALGLAEMSTGRGLRIESLFIDEGFGALDGESLGQAIAVLEHLHASGRRVGVISHVDEVKERIPVKIEVSPVTRGRSTLTVTTG